MGARMTMKPQVKAGAVTNLRDLLDLIADALEILAEELPPSRMMEVLDIVEEVRGE